MVIYFYYAIPLSTFICLPFVLYLITEKVIQPLYIIIVINNNKIFYHTSVNLIEMYLLESYGFSAYKSIFSAK